jgi:hypothetical protein
MELSITILSTTPAIRAISEELLLTLLRGRMDRLQNSQTMNNLQKTNPPMQTTKLTPKPVITLPSNRSLRALLLGNLIQIYRQRPRTIRQSGQQMSKAEK